MEDRALAIDVECYAGHRREQTPRVIILHGSRIIVAVRGSDNLVFANSRRDVEEYTDALRDLATRQRLPDVFWPHHGSLSKAVREDAEDRLKKGESAVTVICTSTLELGIDIGSVTSVAMAISTSRE